jgi:hypothetical protein
MHIITVTSGEDWADEAVVICDCERWKSKAHGDIEIMAQCINHINNEHNEGAISFPNKFIVITDTSITVLDK